MELHSGRRCLKTFPIFNLQQSGSITPLTIWHIQFTGLFSNQTTVIYKGLLATFSLTGRKNSMQDKMISKGATKHHSRTPPLYFKYDILLKSL